MLLDTVQSIEIAVPPACVSWMGLVAALLLTLGTAGAAQAAVPALPAPGAGVDAARLLEAARVPTCVGDEERLELARYRELVASAATVESARDAAIRPSKLARRALTLAGFVQRDDTELERVRAQLAEYEDRVGRAETQQDAATEFEGLVRLAVVPTSTSAVATGAATTRSRSLRSSSDSCSSSFPESSC
jgi:hypothetical protein